MRCNANVAVWAAIILAACSNAGDDDGDGTLVAGSGVPPMMNPVVGNPMDPGNMMVAGAAGGMVPVGGPMMGAAGVAGNTVPVAGMGVAGGMGMAGVGTAGVGMAGMAGVGMAGSGMAGMAGVGMAGMAGGMAGMAGGEAGTVAPPAVKRPCITAGSQVVLIGDSYSNYIVHRSMEDLMTERAIMGGALMQGQQYRDLAAAGTRLQDTSSFGIPAQWTTAARMPPIHLVIMDGGGNDVLIDNPTCLRDGSHMNATCMQVVARSIAVGKDLWMKMKAAGVKDVIWFWYPHIPGTLNGTGHDINDYAFELFKKEAEAFSNDDFRVYFVDTVPIFEGHNEYFTTDGIHANTTGTAKIADAIWMLMKDKCIGQAPSSMCCASM